VQLSQLGSLQLGSPSQLGPPSQLSLLLQLGSQLLSSPSQLGLPSRLGSLWLSSSQLDASQLLTPRSWVARGLAVHRLALLLRMRVVDTWLWALCAPLRVHIATPPRLSRGGRPDSGPSTLSHAPSMFHCLSTSQIPFVLEYSLHSGLVE
jgi:hypothetical protein